MEAFDQDCAVGLQGGTRQWAASELGRGPELDGPVGAGRTRKATVERTSIASSLLFSKEHVILTPSEPDDGYVFEYETGCAVRTT